MILTQWIEPYLTEKAQLMRDDLVSVGFDQDLALAVVELRLAEEDVFDLPERNQKATFPWID